MSGKTFQEYLRFERWILILIAVVFAARLGMSLAGAPITATRWVSLNIVLLIGVVFFSIKVHSTGFGSYKQLFILLWTQIFFAHVLIAFGIVLGVITGMDNAFTVYELSRVEDGKTWVHAALHIAGGGTILPILAWLIGSVILFATKRIKPAS